MPYIHIDYYNKTFKVTKKIANDFLTEVKRQYHETDFSSKKLSEIMTGHDNFLLLCNCIIPTNPVTSWDSQLRKYYLESEDNKKFMVYVSTISLSSRSASTKIKHDIHDSKLCYKFQVVDSIKDIEY